MTGTEGSVVARAREADNLLKCWQSGDTESFDQLFSLFHTDFREIAHRLFARERLNHTLETDDLVNQFYLKMTKGKTIPWHSYTHFLQGSSRAMRQILIDHSRTWSRRPTGKNGLPLPDHNEDGGVQKEPISRDLERMLQLNQAIESLADQNKELGLIADLHVVVGLTMEEIGLCLGLSVSKVKREWALAKKFLIKKL